MRMLATECDTSPANLYKYYSSKDELFTQVVHPVIYALNRLKEEHNKDYRIALESFQHEKSDTLNEILDFLLKYSDAFYLLLYCAQGSPYENYVEDLVQGRVQMAREYLDQLHQKYPQTKVEISDTFLYAISLETIHLFGLMVKRKIPLHERKQIVREYIAYSSGGLKTLILPSQEARQ